MLTEAQLLLLNNLIYRNEFSNPDKFGDNNGKTVREILENVSNSPQQTLTEEEWDAIYAMAQSDTGNPSILDLRVTNMNYEPDTGAKMACFADENGQAYAVFAGTGANEWRDDCVAGTMVDSPQQQRALAWFESLPYDNITVSGHSKGGNKAMYVAIVSDKAGECYAFDGEGFSLEFCEEYKDEIERKKHKIHLRASYRDFVNVLLINIAGDVKYIVNDVGIANASEYHAPNSLFKYENGKIVYALGDGDENSQDPTMEMLNEFTKYLIENATEAEKILALSVLGELLTQFLGGNSGVVREDIIEMFGVEGAEIIIRYLTKYLQDLKVSDPATYLKYRVAFGEFSGDLLGAGFWQFLLGSFLIEPLSKDILFDKIADGTVLKYYKIGEFFLGGNVRGRDFSQAIKTTMINAAKETEDEAWWQVNRWNCWYKVEKFFGGLQWDQYTGKVDEYYRKLIDINDSSVQDIEKIFDEVYEIDEKFSSKVSQATDRLDTNVLRKLENLKNSILPT